MLSNVPNISLPPPRALLSSLTPILSIGATDTDDVKWIKNTWDNFLCKTGLCDHVRVGLLHRGVFPSCPTVHIRPSHRATGEGQNAREAANVVSFVAFCAFEKGGITSATDILFIIVLCRKNGGYNFMLTHNDSCNGCAFQVRKYFLKYVAIRVIGHSYFARRSTGELGSPE